MDGFFNMIRFMVGCGTLLFLAMVLLAHMPKSPLRTLMVQVCGWAGAALCGVMILSPADPIPDFLFPIGFLDDAAALFVGIKSAMAAWNAGKERAAAKEAESNSDEQRHAA